MNEQAGYVYRCAGQTAEQVAALIDACVGSGFAFAGDLVKLSPPVPFSSASAALVEGDFGYVYGPRAELRWRRAHDLFEVLVLTEDAAIRPDQGVPIGDDWIVCATHAILPTMPAGGAAKPQPAKAFYENGSTGAAAFIRYTGE